MTTIELSLLGLAMGVVFGIALEKSRVFEPGMMIGQMQLRNFIMLKVFLAAVATGLVVIAVMNGLGIVSVFPKATVYLANIVGGVILGVGIVIAGACPGTVMAQIGSGYKDAYFTLLGGLCGAMAYGYLEPTIKPALAGGPGKVTLDALTGIPFWVLAIIGAAILAGGMVALERWRPWRNELGRDIDGVFPVDGRPPRAKATDDGAAAPV